MNRIASLLGLMLCLIAVFFAAVFASWLRLRHQTALLRQEAIESRTHQLERALALTQPPALPWSDTYLKDLSAVLDAQIVLPPSEARAPALSPGSWSFVYPLHDDNGQVVARLLVSFSPSSSARIGELYRHTAMILLAVALGLLAVMIIVLAFNLNLRTAQPSFDESRGLAHREFDSLTHLAKVSATQQVELERARSERLRADEDSHYQQVLLNRALEEKIQLGRELHDGIIQSLYATGLTLETAKKHLQSAPADAARELDAGLKSLNNTIRDVRSYIHGLAPENIQQQDFAEAVRGLTQSLAGGRDITYDLRIDEAAAFRLSNEQSTQLLQIAKEAISNGLRHGEATVVTLRLHESADEVGLLVQDNGKGFDPARVERGHGLGNIQARAERIRATARLTSNHEGTRLVVTLPVAAKTS